MKKINTWQVAVLSALGGILLILGILYFFYICIFNDVGFLSQKIDTDTVTIPTKSYLIIANLFHLFVIITGVFCAFLLVQIFSAMKSQYFIALAALLASFVPNGSITHVARALRRRTSEG